MFYIAFFILWVWWFEVWTEIGWMLYLAVFVWPLTVTLYFYFFGMRFNVFTKIHRKDENEQGAIWYMKLGVLILISLIALPIFIYSDGELYENYKI